MSLCAQLTSHQWRYLGKKGPRGRLEARLRTYIAFPLHALIRSVRGATDEVLIATTNPFFLPALLVGARFVHKKRVVVLVWDLFPEAAVSAGLVKDDGWVSRCLRQMNRFYLSRADGVVFIGGRMRDKVVSSCTSPRRLIVIETGASAAEFLKSSKVETESESPEESRDLREWCSGKHIVSYVGNLGLMHDWETLKSGIEPLFEQENRLGVVIAATGPGVEQLKRCWKGIDKGKVRFEGPLEDKDWTWLMNRTEVALVSLKESAKHSSVPSKVFSAMAAGCAIVSVAPQDSDLAQICEENGCGVVVNPGNFEELTMTLKRYLHSQEALEKARCASRQALEARFEMKLLAKKWAGFLGSLGSSAVG